MGCRLLRIGVKSIVIAQWDHGYLLRETAPTRFIACNFLPPSRKISTSARPPTHCISASRRSKSRSKIFKKNSRRCCCREKGNRLDLTASGRSFLRDLEPILESFEQLRRKYGFGAAAARESLAVGGIPGFSTVLLPSLLVQFKQEHPAVNIFLHTGTGEEIQRMVLEGKVELGLVVNIRPSANVRMEFYREEQFVPFVPKSHPLAKRTDLTLAELAEHPLVVRMGREHDHITEEFLAKLNGGRFSAKNVLRSESARAVISLVRKGAGVGLLFKDNIAKNLLRGEFKALKIRDARFTCPSYIIQLMDKPLSACAEKFLDLLRRSRPKENAESNRTIDLRYRQRREQTLFTGID